MTQTNGAELLKIQKLGSENQNDSKLSLPGVASLISKRIKDDIDNYCATAYDDGPRKHLGASLIGHDCKRYLWYVFRWCLHEKHSGRQQRLFNRGHREEARFIEWLKGVGFNIHEYQADGKTQFRISGVNGHFGGSMDGIGCLPESYGIPEKVLFEFKTNGTGAGFNKLSSDSLAIAKPQHFAQVSTYGYKYGFNYVVYLNINKNDDDLYIEVAKLDHNLGKHMEIKAEQIITAKTAPKRLSDNPTFYKCGYCAMKNICHNNAPPEVNCRSCKNATPVENGEWFCSAHNGNIPADFIPKACPSYISITSI